MTIKGDHYPFTEKNVNNAPRQKGVYALYRSKTDKPTYIGMSTVSIRARLQDHYNGYDGECTKNSTYYKREPHSDPKVREKELLNEHKRKYGSSPLCND